MGKTFAVYLDKYYLNDLSFYIAVTSSQPSPALLNWQVIHRKMPWSLVLLLGGGFAIAKACTVSGLSALIGHQLEGSSINDVIELLKLG